jgi:hypothetical protein
VQLGWFRQEIECRCAALVFYNLKRVVEELGGGWQTAPPVIVAAWISSYGRFGWAGEAQSIAILASHSGLMRRSIRSFRRATTATERPRTVRAVVGLRGEQSAGLRPCTPCEGKTTQTPWSLPRAVSSAARAGPRGCVLVRSIARGVIRVQAPVCVGGGRMAAADGGQRERSPALPASSRRSEGPAIRSRPIRIKLCA